jgi:hypothetical protein
VKKRGGKMTFLVGGEITNRTLIMLFCLIMILVLILVFHLYNK